MGWTKLDLVDKAFAQIGLANYVYGLQPEDQQDALSTLDSMMAFWNTKGIRLGYVMASTPDVDGTVDSGLTDEAYLAVYTNLALLLADGVGRDPSANTMRVAKDTYNTLLAKVAWTGPSQLPGNTPLGAGHKGWRGWDRTFIRPPRRHPLAGPDSRLSFRGKKPNQ